MILYEKNRRCCEMSVAEFTGGMPFYKVLNQFEEHNGFAYKTGLNVDIMSFNPRSSCTPGGLYFAREDILNFLGYGPWLREVTIPEDAKVYRDPANLETKWKADKIILGERRKITADIAIELIGQGANTEIFWNYGLIDLAVRDRSMELLSNMRCSECLAQNYIEQTIYNGDRDFLHDVLSVFAPLIKDVYVMRSLLNEARADEDLFTEVLRSFNEHIYEIRTTCTSYHRDLLAQIDRSLQLL
jgi:hypothetical protein